MNKLWKILPAAAVAAGALWSPTASALPMIGLSSNGNGVYDTYADIWTNFTDSALAQGFDPNRTVTSTADGYNTVLTAQAVVGTMSSNGAAVTPLGLNRTSQPIAGVTIPIFELTKVLKIDERVILQSGNTASFGFTNQTFDLDPTTAGSQQLLIYADMLGDGSQAVPGNGSGTVRCYGFAATSGAANGCSSDGVLALSASLISLSSSFAADATGANVGTGSFDLRFKIDYVNSNYLDIQRDSIIGDKLTGTINFPSFYNPERMFDGTSTAAGLLLKVDSSESFIAAAIPEPASLALMGLALFGVGAASRRRRS